MNIIKSDPPPLIMNLKNKEDFINRLITQIMIICKEDNYFPISKKIKKLEEYKRTLQEKNNNLTILLEKSNKIKEGMNKQLAEIEENSLKLREHFINKLGGEV